MAFKFPAIYDLPPFFTLQPVLNTRKQQLQLWGDLILDYSKAKKKYEYDVTEKNELFVNQKINRKLNPEAIRAIFEDLVDRGNAEWQDKEKRRITIYWRRPEEWGNLIYQWVDKSGKNNSVLTVYEIQQGEDTEKQEFHGLETKLLLKALKSLERQGKCQIFSGNQEDNLGVKFFSI